MSKATTDHYEWMVRAGRIPASRTSTVGRFVQSFRKTDGCWEWTAHADKAGYGYFRIARIGQVKAHRFAYEAFRGAIPPGLTLDHLCRNRRCVNPDHLEPVTGRVNTLRGDGLGARNARKTHCMRGHPLSGDNLYRYRNQRICRACRRQSAP